MAPDERPWARSFAPGAVDTLPVSMIGKVLRRHVCDELLARAR
jgi:hypothetical protein